MAKAAFHKHQRVYVKPVGTWAAIEQVKPQWVKDVEEPVKIFYDCGLGRDFTASELAAEAMEDTDTGRWRLMRAKNKWQSPDECAHHPQPGTYPVVVTDAQNWGGWRVPGAEYDRDPARIEHQARLIVHAPRLLQLAEAVAREAAENPDAGSDFVALGRRAADIARAVRARPDDGDTLKAAG
ncbi:MAG: hypothetical protein ACOC0V_05555 [Oceanicaulis sp.]